MFSLTGTRDYSGSQTPHQVIIQWRWKTNIYEKDIIRDEDKQFDYNKKEIIILQNTDTVYTIECIVVQHCKRFHIIAGLVGGHKM